VKDPSENEKTHVLHKQARPTATDQHLTESKEPSLPPAREACLDGVMCYTRHGPDRNEAPDANANGNPSRPAAFSDALPQRAPPPRGNGIRAKGSGNTGIPSF
jgi:hypothetical protein